jgi:hypothetical protein
MSTEKRGEVKKVKEEERKRLGKRKVIYEL